ncbi:MAG: porin family protein [Bacteroidia bacterium]
MKKSIFFAALLVSVTSISMAQESTTETDFRESLRFGVKVGVNNSNVYDSNGEKFKADGKFGFVGGAFLAIPIGKYLGVQPEVLFSQKGFQANGTLLGSPYKVTRTTSYLDIPLQIALKPSEFITILAGPQYSYLIKQNDKFTSSIINTQQEQEFKNENIRKNMFGVVGGLDINLKHFIISGRLGWDISQNNGDGTTSTPRYKNRWIQATIGYAF